MLILHQDGVCQAAEQEMWAILIYKLPSPLCFYRNTDKELEQYIVWDKCMFYPDLKTLEKDWDKSLLIDRQYWKQEKLTPLKKKIRVAKIDSSLLRRQMPKDKIKWAETSNSF